jgi:hypothetical protein
MAGNKVNHWQVKMVGSGLLEVCSGGKNLSICAEICVWARYHDIFYWRWDGCVLAKILTILERATGQESSATWITSSNLAFALGPRRNNESLD